MRKQPEERYFVDERVGCIAVRDREHTDPEYRGLHADTNGVVQYWHGNSSEPLGPLGTDCLCPTCRQRRMNWSIADTDHAAAHALCAELNKMELNKEITCVTGSLPTPT
jgi:hypothetical protein